mgnify:FL=1|jgi:hypothetical protein|tara:strand:- start:162 stop:599 length:438 start_codon:yes stop_codon:yes gene_type:complete
MGLYKEKDRYLVDIMGVATVVDIGFERYDDIYNKPTIMYSLTYENKSLKDLEDDTISFEDNKRCRTSGVSIVTGKRKKEYQLPFSDTGYRSDFSNIIDYDPEISFEDVIQISAKQLLKENGIHREKYFDSETFEDKPIVSVVNKI